jgi:aromatic-L-amino-acid/L-tryptophan decarboxylase
MNYSPELTRHFRGLRLWFSLKVHGMEAFRAAIDEKLILAAQLYRELSKFKELKMFSEPELSIVAFRCVGDSPAETNERTQRLLAKVIERGKVHFSSTQIGGFDYLRLCVLSFRTHKNEILEAVNEIKESFRWVGQ